MRGVGGGRGIPTVPGRAAGDLDRAEAVARTIPNPDRRARALARLAVVIAGASELDRGEVTQTITNPADRAQALADVAGHAAANQAQSLLAQALTVGHWDASAVFLARVNPVAVNAIADEYLNA